MTTTNRKLKILAIHGYRQSDITFRAKLGSLRKGFKQKIEFIFANAPHTVPPIDNSENDEENDTIAEGRGWWFNTEDHYFKAIESSNLSVGFEESVKSIENIIEEQGPFDGILGFSQGASFVSILCAMQQKKLLSENSFQFSIMISGFKSLCQPHVKFYDESISLPSLHVYGESDKIIPTEMARDLAELFTNKRVVIHEGGHYIPGKKNIYQDFFNEMYVICNC